jgi:RNA polymerase sigma-70 factor (ECF subfamily)
LVAAALAGEGEAFAHLVRRYQAALVRAAESRLGRRAWAEEAVQETFLCTHRWLESYDSRYSFRTWLWTILLNQCTRLAKREQRQPLSSLPAAAEDEPECQAASPLDQLLASESCERLHALLSQLPEAQADALRLRFFGELTFPEIAAAMRISEPGAKHRVKAGLLKLSEWLNVETGHSLVVRGVAQ